MHETPPEILRRVLAAWDDAETLDALDELDAAMTHASDAPGPRTPEERDAGRAARDDWKRASAALAD